MTKIIGATTPTVANNTSLAASVTTVTVSTSSLAQFASEDFNLTTSKEGCLVSFQASRSCLVRVYSTSAARSGDNRAYNVVVPASGVTGLIAEVEIDTAVANSVVTNIVYANEDSPQAGVLYLKVFNLGAVGVVELDVGNTQFLAALSSAELIASELNALVGTDRVSYNALQDVPAQTNYGSFFATSPTIKNIPLFTAPRATIINELRGVKTSAGTATLSIQVGGVNVTGLTNLSITDSPQNFTATGGNTVSVGTRVTVNITAVSSAVDLEFTMGATLN